jgi:hypothetical protein
VSDSFARLQTQSWWTTQWALLFIWDAISEAFTLVCIKRHVFGRMGAEGHLKCSILKRKPAMAKPPIDQTTTTQGRHTKHVESLHVFSHWCRWTDRITPLTLLSMNQHAAKVFKRLADCFQNPFALPSALELLSCLAASNSAWTTGSVAYIRLANESPG